MWTNTAEHTDTVEHKTWRNIDKDPKCKLTVVVTWRELVGNKVKWTGMADIKKADVLGL